MRNGIKDMIEMHGIAHSLDKIRRLYDKYELPQPTSLKINERITLEYKILSCFVCVNNMRVIKYNFSMFGGLSKVMAGASLGIIKSDIKFIVRDKNIANHKFIKETSILLNDFLLKLENDLKIISKKRWE